MAGRMKKNEGLEPLVGRHVVYAPSHGKREDGVVTSTARRSKIPAVFVRYGDSETSKLTYVRDLETINGTPLEDELR